MTALVTSATDWSPKLIEQVYKEIEQIALEELRLDVYPNQIEIISAEQMIDAYASIGLPVHYSHWSFGKSFLRDYDAYRKGQRGLAYEIIINSNPCIAYLMEENDMVMQTLVMAHACFGHNFVFKNNFFFKEWTQAGSIVDFMIFAQDVIRHYEQRYGAAEVERVLDAAHALAFHGVDKYKRAYKKKLTEDEVEIAEVELREDDARTLDHVIRKTMQEQPNQRRKKKKMKAEIEAEENMLYFLEKNSPTLKPWQREIIRIVRKVAQYFYPQRVTKHIHEGFATFTHNYILNRLEEKGILSPDAMIAAIQYNSGVIFQPSYRKRYYNGINPYSLAFRMFQDIKRICVEPTKEDEEWFPHLIGKDWVNEVQNAVREHRDDSFFQQYLSPKLIRDYHLFEVTIEDEAIVTDIHDDMGYRSMRSSLAENFNQINWLPEIMVTKANMNGDRKATLQYFPYEKRPLHEDYAELTLSLFQRLWGNYPVELIQRTKTAEGKEIEEELFALEADDDAETGTIQFN